MISYLLELQRKLILNLMCLSTITVRFGLLTFAY
ncbi:unnamed protein product [Paramecium octaurelia]|uniref:Uncharacterized protein n=1 Tax=Paramecium octaurelia TaxID=43137 RepID=A0A8S1VBK1_PAROT|nr:unnamed protein product [Paramecium octaurelia]